MAANILSNAAMLGKTGIGVMRILALLGEMHEDGVDKMEADAALAIIRDYVATR